MQFNIQQPHYKAPNSQQPHYTDRNSQQHSKLY
jgi:hypothetical protein